LRFYTIEEFETWLLDRQRQKPDLMPGVRVERIEYPPAPYRVFFFAHWVASELTYCRPTLLFITEWGIWPNSENWHLYYKLRHGPVLTFTKLRTCVQSAENLPTYLNRASANGVISTK
jgi:hypothetical protein